MRLFHFLRKENPIRLSSFMGLLNISLPWHKKARGKIHINRRREWSKMSVQQGHSPLDARSVLSVREHGKRARTPLAAFFNIPFMNQYVAITLMCSGIFLFPSLSSAATLYAKKDGVKVTTEKSPTSAVVTTLALGDPVTVLSESGRIAKVKTSTGKTGWVFKFRLSKEKPSSGGGGFGLSGLTGRKTLAARESRAGGSIRGLKESTEQYAKSKHISQEHRDAVDRMEAFSLLPDELMEFQKVGHLGEFSGGAE